MVDRSGARRVITCSASAYWAFVNLYPRLGVKLEGVQIEHVSTAIEALIEQHALTLPPQQGGNAVTYHDSCKLGRLAEPYPEWSGVWAKAMNQVNITAPPRPVPFGNTAIHDAPRRLIDRTGAARVEMQRNRQFAYCCGALGGGKEAYPDFARHAAQRRLEEASASGAATVVSACGSCTAHLREVALDCGSPVRVQGLFEFLLTSATASKETAR